MLWQSLPCGHVHKYWEASEPVADIEDDYEDDVDTSSGGKEYGAISSQARLIKHKCLQRTE